MAYSRPRVIFLTGAPLAEELEWDEKVLNPSFTPAIKQFLDALNSGALHIPLESPATSSSESRVPDWRSIPPDGGAHLPTGLSQASYNDSSFLSGHSIRLNYMEETSPLELQDVDMSTTIMENTTEHVSYLSHSLALHETLLSSQVDESESFLTGSTPGLDALLVPHPEIPINLRITALSALPTATDLREMAPHTPTPNLLVAVISISAPRTVTVRKTQREASLIELYVADETKLGFSITVWLHGSPDGNAPDQALRSLRPGDIVLFRNVALSVYNGAVHGQSLNPALRRAQTHMHILQKNGAILISPETLHPLSRDKIERLSGWVDKFVGRSTSRKRKAAPFANEATEHLFKGVHDECGGRGQTWASDELPPDTQ